jgi:hypothetical protein
MLHEEGIDVLQTFLVWINFAGIGMKLGMIVNNNELQIKFEFCLY